MATKLPDKVAEQRRQVVDKIVEDMERDGLSWARPWQHVTMPHNPISGTFYRGGNHLHLMAVAQMRGYADPRWVTFKQAKKAGWDMHKGSKAAVVEKWKSFKIRDEDEPDNEEKARVVLRCVGYFNVFNAECFDGVPPLEQMQPNTDVEVGELANDVIASSRCEVDEIPSESAFYSPLSDHIVVPEREAFKSNEAFLGTLLHEMGHSTGHPTALNRDLVNKFGSEGYAFEELVAELSSVFSASDLGIEAEKDIDSPHYQQHVAYLASWKQALRDDPDVMFRAAAQADKASDYVIDRYEEHVGHEAPGRANLRKQMIGDTEKANGKTSSLDAKREEIQANAVEHEGTEPSLADRGDGMER